MRRNEDTVPRVDRTALGSVWALTGKERAPQTFDGLAPGNSRSRH